MISWRSQFLILFDVIIFFIILLLTLSNSRYTCQVMSDGRDETCAENGILGDESLICQGTVFVIAAQTSSKSILILCPWDGMTVTLTCLGVIGAFIFAGFVLLESIKPISRKLIMLTGFGTFPILLLSTFLMIIGISDGGKKCEKFEDDMTQVGSRGLCYNAAFGIQFILSLGGMLLFGYETILSYYRYKFRNDEAYNDYRDDETSIEPAKIDNDKTLKMYDYELDES